MVLSYSSAVGSGYCFLSSEREFIMSVLVVRMSAFLFTLYTAVCKTKLVWPRPKVVVPGSNGPQFQGARWARQALRDSRSNSILK